VLNRGSATWASEKSENLSSNQKKKRKQNAVARKKTRELESEESPGQRGRWVSTKWSCAVEAAESSQGPAFATRE